jgi:hypothetical protein
MSGNYPAGVHENTPGAPWNCGNSFRCNGCGRWCYETEHEHRTATRFDCDAAAEYPSENTAAGVYGLAAELCAVCAEYVLVCGYCGEHRETENPWRFFNFENPADTLCVWCAAVCACDDIETAAAAGVHEMCGGVE